MSYDLKCLASGRAFHGYLTLENLDAVADRIRDLIGDGQHYTWVACNEGLGDYRPEVRTGQVAKTIEADRRDSDGKLYGSITVNDTYGVWGIHTAVPDQAASPGSEVGFDLAYLRITRGQIQIEHRAPAGHRLYWVAAVERAS